MPKNLDQLLFFFWGEKVIDSKILNQYCKMRISFYVHINKEICKYPILNQFLTIKKLTYIMLISLFSALILYLILRSKMRISSCFYFDEKAYKKVVELHKTENTLKIYKKKRIYRKERNNLSVHLPFHFIIKANEVQLLKPQKRAFCIFIQNIFFETVLKNEFDYIKFEKALRQKIPNGEKLDKKEKFDYIKKEVAGIFLPRMEFNSNNLFAHHIQKIKRKKEYK